MQCAVERLRGGGAAFKETVPGRDEVFEIFCCAHRIGTLLYGQKSEHTLSRTFRRMHNWVRTSVERLHLRRLV